MGTTAFSTLIEYARLRMANSSTTNATTIIKTAVNNAMKRVGREDFYEFLRRGRINMVATYSTGTVTVTKDSATLTGSGSAWSTAAVAAKDKIIVNANTNVEHEVSSVGGETTITLVNEWVDTTAAAQAYNIYRNSFAVPSTAGSEFRKMFEPEGEDFFLTWVSPPLFESIKLADKNQTSSDPEWATVINGRIELYPYPTSTDVIDYLYYAWPKTLSADGGTIDLDDTKLPLLHRAIDVELALFPGVDMNPGEAEAIYSKYLQDFISSDRKAWRVQTIKTPPNGPIMGTRSSRAFRLTGRANIN